MSFSSANQTKRDPPIDPLIGEQIQEYQIISLLGAGGMGKVYLAKHTKIGKKIAIKLLQESLSGDGESLERFFREARAVNEIQHENIIDIFNFIHQAGQKRAYIMMEYLDGRPASAAIKTEAPFPVQRVGHIGIQICSALYAAHQQKIIHRDLKPDNLFLLTRAGQRDFVKVLDFGLAKLQDREGAEALTSMGITVGTPHYMSPEQALGEEIDARSDVYALGVLLYEMATRTLPFVASNVQDVMRMHVSAPLTSPRKRHAGVTPALEAVILRCLEKEAEARYQTMAELAFDLGRACHLEIGPYFGDEFASARFSPVRGNSALSKKLSSIKVTGLHGVVPNLSYEDAPTSLKRGVSNSTLVDPEEPPTIPYASGSDLYDSEPATMLDLREKQRQAQLNAQNLQDEETHVGQPDKDKTKTSLDLSKDYAARERVQRAQTFVDGVLSTPDVAAYVSSKAPSLEPSLEDVANKRPNHLIWAFLLVCLLVGGSGAALVVSLLREEPRAELSKEASLPAKPASLQTTPENVLTEKPTSTPASVSIPTEVKKPKNPKDAKLEIIDPFKRTQPEPIDPFEKKAPKPTDKNKVINPFKSSKKTIQRDL